jgi:CDP-diacylglycerol--glycerol-3-phosphate 3-phosphatidyltransferase
VSADPAPQPAPRPTPPGDALLSDRLKAGGRAFLEPVVNALAAAGVTPNAVTVAGLVLVVIASVLIWQRELMLGAGLLAIGAALDAVDGGLARARGGGTPFGAFLDSTLDRTGEAVAYVGIVAFWLDASSDPFVPVMVAVLALSGSFLVSYSRARAEAAGFTASNGLAPRTERLLILVIGLVIAGLGSFLGLVIATALIAILAWATVAQRIWFVRRQAAEAADEPADIGSPEIGSSDIGSSTIGQDKEF